MEHSGGPADTTSTSARGRSCRTGRGCSGGLFSDPSVDCKTDRCGVPINERDGAHAVKSLDMVRFQVAARRAAKPDRDGDGIVDVADAVPDDPADWVDWDGDGIGDNADSDDDGDGVADTDDPFPRDATEWVDADQDGIGDNADEEVTDLSPFRDAALRAAVERALGKDAGATITAEDLSTLTGLSARERNIDDLTGLELATNLETLILGRNEIADVSPLAGLTQLGYLGLPDNRIADITPLTGLARLWGLSLQGNPLRDLSALENFRQLTSLSVGSYDHEIPGASVPGRVDESPAHWNFCAWGSRTCPCYLD